MSDGALIFLALLVSIAGMGTLALSIEAHWRQVMSKRVQTASARRGLRLAGATLLAVAFLQCAAADPLSMAALVWPMLLTVAAAIVAGWLTLHARFSAGAGGTGSVDQIATSRSAEHRNGHSPLR